MGIGFFFLQSCGENGGSIFSTAGQTQNQKGKVSDSPLSRSVRTHIPGLPTTGHSDYGQPKTLTVSGKVVVRPGEESGIFRAGPRSVVLSGGSLVGTTLSGDLLATSETDGEGNFTLEVPAGTDHVLVTANKDPISLKVIVTRLPSEDTVVDADSATVAVMTEQGVGAVGTQLNLEQLVDSLDTQVNRNTSLLSEMSDAHQGMIDELVNQAGTGVRSSGNRGGRNDSASTDAFSTFMKGDFTSDQTVRDVVAAMGVQRNSVMALRSTIMMSFSVNAGMMKNRAMLTPDQLAQLGSAFQVGLRASNVNDSVEDSLVTTCFYSYIMWTMGEFGASGGMGMRVRQSQVSGDAALYSVTQVTDKFKAAVTDSQNLQTLLAQQYNFGSMLNDFTFNHARKMAEMGASQEEIISFVQELTQAVVMDLLSATGSNANGVLNGALGSARDALENAGIAGDLIDATIQTWENNLRPVAEKKIEEDRNQSVSG